MNSSVKVDGETGYIFGSQIPGSYSFVPERCVTVAPDGKVMVDEKSYFLSGWSIRNMRWADAEPGGSHLFPDIGQLVNDIALPAVQQFLARVTSRSRHPFAYIRAD